MDRRIALACDITLDKNRDVVRAVLASAHRLGRWRVQLFPEPARQIAEIVAWQPHAAIAQLTSAALATRLRQAIPMLINVSNVVAIRGVPQVCNDDVAVAQTAVAHLRAIGCQRLAFVGRSTQRFEQLRWLAFRTAAAGLRPRRINLHDLADLRTHFPLGLLCSSDRLAAQVVASCRDLGLSVPGQVAVLGMGDEEIFCFGCDPVLSSIPLSGAAIGTRAAELLADRLMGRRIPAQTRIPPGAVAVRASSDRQSKELPQVTLALDYLRDHAHEAIGITDLVHHVGGSRRALELGFRQHLGRSPHQELRRLRLERAQHLLASTDLPLTTVAERSGIAQAAHLCQLFRRFTGLTPLAWRRANRL